MSSIDCLTIHNIPKTVKMLPMDNYYLMFVITIITKDISFVQKDATRKNYIYILSYSYDYWHVCIN